MISRDRVARLRSCVLEDADAWFSPNDAVDLLNAATLAHDVLDALARGPLRDLLKKPLLKNELGFYACSWCSGRMVLGDDFYHAEDCAGEWLASLVGARV